MQPVHSEAAPLVSIGVPVYNGARYLEAALDGLRAQTFRNYEVLIADNGSTDETQQIAERYAAEDTRVTYVRHPENIGAAGNFNYVFDHTRGKYFKWAAHDDVMAPEYLADAIAALEADMSGAVLAYPQTMRIDENGALLGINDTVTRKGGATPDARLDHMIGPGDRTASYCLMCFPVFGVIKRSALERSSRIANFPRSDTLLIVELALMGPYIEIEEPHFLRREHDEGSVISVENAAEGLERERRLAAWFDPKRHDIFPATRTRLALGYIRAVLRTSMPLRSKIKSFRIAFGWFWQNVRLIRGEVRILVTEAIMRRMRPIIRTSRLGK